MTSPFYRLLRAVDTATGTEFLSVDEVPTIDHVVALIAHYGDPLTPPQQQDLRVNPPTDDTDDAVSFTRLDTLTEDAPGIHTLARVTVHYEIVYVTQPDWPDNQATPAEKLATAQAMFETAAANPNLDWSFVSDLDNYLHNHNQEREV